MSADGVSITIELIEGPYDGKVLKINQPGDGAPEFVRVAGAEVHQYRAPGVGAEMEEAVTAFEMDEPVKYRYAGKVE